MKKALFCLIGSALFVAAQPLAADTWKGTISDASCAAKHSAEKHGDASMKHEACALTCHGNLSCTSVLKKLREKTAFARACVARVGWDGSGAR